MKTSTVVRRTWIQGYMDINRALMLNFRSYAIQIQQQKNSMQWKWLPPYFHKNRIKWLWFYEGTYFSKIMSNWKISQPFKLYLIQSGRGLIGKRKQNLFDCCTLTRNIINNKIKYVTGLNVLQKNKKKQNTKPLLAILSWLANRRKSFAYYWK